MVDNDKMLRLLGSGLAPVDVATTLGCDPSYISQKLMDEAFRAQVLALRMESLASHTERDKRIDKLEDVILEKLENLLPYITNIKQAMTAFQLLNAAKRRGAQTAGGDLGLGQQVVRIVLPVVARDYFFPKVNAQGEVVQVGEQITTTIPLAQLLQERMLKNRKENAQDAQEIEYVDANKAGNGEQKAA